MLKKTIKYNNPFTGEEVEETFYFHLSKAELIELEMGTEGGLSEALKRIVAEENPKKIIAEFKNIILSAYGERSENGRFFKKTQQLRDEFESSEAYSALFMEILTDAEAAAVFVNSIVPVEVAEAAAKEAAELTQKESQAELSVVPPADEPEDESKEVRESVPSDDEIEKEKVVITEPDQPGKSDN